MELTPNSQPNNVQPEEKGLIQKAKDIVKKISSLPSISFTKQDPEDRTRQLHGIWITWRF